MGLGAYPANDRQFIDMLGMHGSYRANMALSHCDLLIAVGSRFDDRVTGKLSEFSPLSKKIHIDVDPTSIDKNVKVDAHVLGDMKTILEALTKSAGSHDYDEWYDQLDSWHGKHPLAFKQNPNGPILPQFAVDEIYRSPRATPSSLPRWVSTRCGRPSITASTSHADGSPPAGWGPWVSGSRPPSGPPSLIRTPR